MTTASGSSGSTGGTAGSATSVQTNGNAPDLDALGNFGMGSGMLDQPNGAEAAATMAVGSNDVTAATRHKVGSELGAKIGDLGDTDILGAQHAALAQDAAKRSAEAMDEATKLGVAAPPVFQLKDLSAWRAERQATAQTPGPELDSGKPRPPMP